MVQSVVHFRVLRPAVHKYQDQAHRHSIWSLTKQRGPDPDQLPQSPPLTDRRDRARQGPRDDTVIQRAVKHG